MELRMNFAKKSVKKLLAFLLTVCLCLGSMNVSVFADTTEEGTGTPDTPPVETPATFPNAQEWVDQSLVTGNITEMNLGETYDVSITEAYQKVWFKFTAPTTDKYQFFSSNNESDPYGSLYLYKEIAVEDTEPAENLVDKGYELLAADDDAWEENNFFIAYELTAGTDYFLCASCFGDGTGTYTVAVKEFAAPIKIELSNPKPYSPFYYSENMNDYIDVTIIYEDDTSTKTSVSFIYNDNADNGYYTVPKVVDAAKEEDFNNSVSGKYTIKLQLAEKTYNEVDDSDVYTPVLESNAITVEILDIVQAAAKKGFSIGTMDYAQKVSVAPLYDEWEEGYVYKFNKFVPQYDGIHVVENVDGIAEYDYNTENNNWSFNCIDEKNQPASWKCNNDGKSVAVEMEKGKTYYIGVQTRELTTNFAVNYYGGLSKPDPSKAMIPANSISLSKASTNILVGRTEALSTSFSPANANQKSLTWTSSNASVVAVDGNGNVYGVAAGTAVITATTSNGKKATCTVTVSPVYINGVAINAAAVDVNKGATVGLIASVGPVNATYKAVTWTSSNPAVATVDANGVVTGIAKGKAIITVTSADGSNISASCTVTVKVPATKLSLAKKTIYLKKGASYTISTIVAPADSTDEVTFKTSNKKVATVSKKGKVVAKKKGTATITVKAGTKTVKVKVKVDTKTAKVKKLNITKKKLTLKKGAVSFLAYKVNPTKANQKFTWKSSKKSVVTVDSNGKVTAKKKGTATITVSANGKKDTIKITVK